MSPARGEVWLVNLDPTIGDEVRKVRPGVVVSRDAVGVLALRVVVPITGWQPDFAGAPWLVRIEPSPHNGLTKTSAADAFQAKSLSTRRLLRRIGTASTPELTSIVRAVGTVIEHP